MKKLTILVGVTASIAIYRSAELVRELSKRGHSVRVAMTRTAALWMSPVIFSALSSHSVYTEDNHKEDGMPHIVIRDNLDLFITAPATADFISRAAAGHADDLLTATLLSYSGPRWIAPSMNPNMFRHPATQKNIDMLESYGYKILSPADGEAVCGDKGEGKMMPVQDIVSAIEDFAAHG